MLSSDKDWIYSTIKRWPACRSLSTQVLGGLRSKEYGFYNKSCTELFGEYMGHEPREVKRSRERVGIRIVTYQSKRNQ
jgi:hypothetical protein